jgi:hypothetical protein
MVLALVPLSIISILVKHPNDLEPLGSIYWVSLRASLVERSWFAGTTHKMIDLSSLI